MIWLVIVAMIAITGPLIYLAATHLLDSAPKEAKRSTVKKSRNVNAPNELQNQNTSQQSQQPQRVAREFSQRNAKRVGEISRGVPETSPLKRFIAALDSSSVDRVVAACEEIIQHIEHANAVTVGEAKSLIAVAATLRFPDEISLDWSAMCREFIQFPKEKCAQLVETAKSYYAQSNPDIQQQLLNTMALSGTREGAEAFAECIRKHGWPDVDTVMPEVFQNLECLSSYADVLYPAILFNSSPNVFNQLSFNMRGVDKAELDADKLEEVSALVCEKLPKLVSDAREYQEHPSQWTNQPRYDFIRQSVESFCNLTIVCRLEEARYQIEELLQYKDPSLLCSAIPAALVMGIAVDEESIMKVARNGETSEVFKSSLSCIGRRDLMPETWDSWEAYAVSEIIGWLSHSTQLAHSPATISLMMVWDDFGENNDQTIFIWRFQKDAESPYMAAISGPYDTMTAPGSHKGESTFSTYTEWTGKTPAQHVSKIMRAASKQKQPVLS